MELIGVSGIRTHLPPEFPSSLNENSGNIVHGTAPQKLFGNTITSLDPTWRRFDSSGSFRNFVADHCSHIIITCANLFRVGDFSESSRERYKHFERSLKGYTKPLIIFGLGAQAPTGTKVDRSKLPPEAIQCLNTALEVSTAISVRGEFTRSVVESAVGSLEDKVFTTGCPSFYTNPRGLNTLRNSLQEKGRSISTAAVNVTDYRRAEDIALVRAAVENGHFIVEPQSRILYNLKRSAHRQDPFPETSKWENLQFLANAYSRESLQQYFTSKLKFFRHIDPWLDFNRSYVDFTLGTRFHVNMASALSGVPTVWLTHDARTSELVDALHLPSAPLKAVRKKSIDQLFEEADFDAFISAVPRKFADFNTFLSVAGLPAVDSPW